MFGQSRHRDLSFCDDFGELYDVAPALKVVTGLQVDPARKTIVLP